MYLHIWEKLTLFFKKQFKNTKQQICSYRKPAIPNASCIPKYGLLEVLNTGNLGQGVFQLRSHSLCIIIFLCSVLTELCKMQLLRHILGTYCNSSR